MGEPLFEPAALERATAGDAALRAELLRLFDDEARELVGRLSDALRGGDRAAARAAAHRLRGSAGIVGAHRLRAACAELESALQDAPEAAWSALTATIREVAAATLAALSGAAGPGER